MAWMDNWIKLDKIIDKSDFLIVSLITKGGKSYNTK